MQNIDVNQAKQRLPELIEAHLPVGGGANLDISSGNSYFLRRIISHSQRRTKSNVVSAKYLKRHSLPAIHSDRNKEIQSGAG